MRTKQVFETREIPHLWAHQTQDEARNHGGNLYFRGDTIYSYGSHFPIARIVEFKGRKCVFFVNHGYSHTTNKHISFTRSAVPNYPVFHVDCPVDRPQDAWKQIKENVKRSFARFKLAKNRANVLNGYRDYLALIGSAEQFAEFFRYKPAFKLADNHAELLTQIDVYQRELTQRQVLRDEKSRERHAAKRAESERIAALEMPQLIEEWRAGGSFDYWRVSRLPTMLRIKGDNVETSKGASFPVDHAIRIMPIVERIIARGEEWKANGQSIHLGHYVLDSIDSSGTITAGCHIVPRDEVLRLIEELKRIPQDA